MLEGLGCKEPSAVPFQGFLDSGLVGFQIAVNITLDVEMVKELKMDIYFCLELPSKLDAFLEIGSDPDHFIINEKDSSADEEVFLSETLGECLVEKGP